MAISDRIAAVTRARPKAAAPKIEPDERRWAQRKTGVASGLIDFHPAKAPVACIIRDMSATGARLEAEQGWWEAFDSADDIPDTITLLVRLDKIEVDCAVVWRKAQSIGVRFKGGLRPLSRRLASRHAPPLPAKP